MKKTAQRKSRNSTIATGTTLTAQIGSQMVDLRIMSNVYMNRFKNMDMCGMTALNMILTAISTIAC